MPANNRSRLGNGSALPSGTDGRRSAARRWKEIFRDGMARTGGRHETLCRSYASLVVRREMIDAEVVRGVDVDVDLLLRIASEIRRTAERLGLLGDLPGEDETDAAIDALRGHREHEAHAR